MRILHVVEVKGGGVWDAVHQYVDNLPDDEHCVAGTDADHLPRFADIARVESLSGGLMSRRKAVKRLAADFRPDVIHAHSSFAGVTTRTIRVDGRPIVYQPHAFYFSSESLHPAKRLLTWVAERVLSFRTAAFIALSSHEVEQMARLAPRVPAFVVHNTSALVPSGSHPDRPGFVVAMSGRVTTQKSPELFAAIAERLRAVRPDAAFVWLGDGEPTDRATLESAGVTVSGWLDRAALTDALQGSDVYLHTAAYEGFPLSILDASAVRLPLLVRDRPYSRDWDVAKFREVDEAARILTTWHDDRAALQAERARSHAIDVEFSPDVQRNDLNTAYGAVRRRTS